MTGALRQVVYISRAAASVSDDEVSKIGQESRFRNSASGITGVLLYDGSRFIQAIEGDAVAIKHTTDRIFADPRHTHIDVAVDRTVERRQFGTWSMQARKTATGACSASFLRKIKNMMEGVDDAGLQALFIGFTILGGSKNKYS